LTRIPLIAGNWKMNKTIAETVQLLNALLKADFGQLEVEILVCPPFTALQAAAEALKGSSIRLGAQNLHWEEAGAYTGEISAAMIGELCEYVIIGHSERRALFGETDQSVNQKVKSALAHRLKPIVCVGETLDQNESGQTAEVVSRQVRLGLAELDRAQVGDLVIAYEPVWAIGTGKAATPEAASDVVEVIIRPALEFVFDRETAQAARVLYGGSVNPDNARAFFRAPGIDGGLVGGASLEAGKFTAIIEAAA
jgi:triosephosphate isomerase (TIM)